VLTCAALAACADTSVVLAPSPQPPVCDPAAAALVLWAPQWRANQKDVPEREQAAEAGLQDFLATSGCFARSELRRVADLGSASLASQLDAAVPRFDRAVGIAVRELGPVLELLGSLALVEGGTEVVLHIGVLSVQKDAAPREFTVHWQHGGPGVIKGVASLRADMRSALIAGLQPRTRTE